MLLNSNAAFPLFQQTNQHSAALLVYYSLSIFPEPSEFEKKYENIKETGPVSNVPILILMVFYLNHLIHTSEHQMSLSRYTTNYARRANIYAGLMPCKCEVGEYCNNDFSKKI
jgi:hypothetical protein